MQTVPDPDQESISPKKHVPPIVNGLLAFFYVATVSNVLYFTWLAVQIPDEPGDQLWGPVGSFLLLYAGFFVYNWLHRPPVARPSAICSGATIRTSGSRWCSCSPTWARSPG